MLNRRRRLHHSSRVILPLVNMTASWFLVSTYLIWILGSKLILSNKQSNATLWAPDTCLNKRLRPLMIILITSSLSSRMCSLPFTSRRSCVCGHVIQTWHLWHAHAVSCCFLNPLLFPRRFLGWWFLVVRRMKHTTSHKSEAWIPSIRKPASNEITSDSVELRDRTVLHIHPTYKNKCSASEYTLDSHQS